MSTTTTPTIDVPAFLAWLESQEPNRVFDIESRTACPIACYLRSQGGFPEARVIDRRYWWPDPTTLPLLLPGVLDRWFIVACYDEPRPYTIRASTAADILRMLLAKSGGVA